MIGELVSCVVLETRSIGPTKETGYTCDDLGE